MGSASFPQRALLVEPHLAEPVLRNHATDQMQLEVKLKSDETKQIAVGDIPERGPEFIDIALDAWDRILSGQLVNNPG